MNRKLGIGYVPVGLLLLALLIPAGCAMPDRSWIADAQGAGRTVSPLAPRVGSHEGLPLVRIDEQSIIIPTYPYEDYQSPAFDEDFRWLYKRFDLDRFRDEMPQPHLRQYRMISLENEYLQVLILPELGGRVWQVMHKSSANRIFYQNPVVKPTPWGPPQQLGWLAIGGLEWNLPVNEHGYDWGTTWHAQTFVRDDGSAGVALSTPDDGRLLQATIIVSLRPDAARLDITHELVNRSEGSLDFDYWETALLAPGRGNELGKALQFVLPGDLMTLHSSGDPLLPGPKQRFTWPTYAGRDLSRLGEWNQYLGFFEYPAARGPFVGVYDLEADAGAVRIFPADVMRGSKVFGLGWQDALSSDYYTDDGSAYVELHGGLSSSFFEQAQLDEQERLTWQESWYPVQGIGELMYANDVAAIGVVQSRAAVQVGIHTVRSLRGTVRFSQNGIEFLQHTVHFDPNQPYTEQLPANLLNEGFGYNHGGQTLDVEVLDETGAVLLAYGIGL